MNMAKFQSIERSLTGIARKVLESTPIAQPWTISQICSDMRRMGHNAEHGVVAGCLNSLVQQGIIKEPASGSFIQVSRKVAAEPKLSIAPQPAPPVKPPPSHPAPAPSPTPAPSPIPAPAPMPAAAADTMTRLSELAQTVRDLSHVVVDIAVAIDDAALEIETRMEQAQQDTVKLKQLRALLKGIHGDD